MEILDKINCYISAKDDLKNSLEKVSIDADLYYLHKLSFLSLIKDLNFEVKIFELLLNLDKDEALIYLEKFYLKGNPKSKSRFKGNLEILLDDLKIALGEEIFREVIDRIPKSNLKFYAIKQAIDFANDDS